MNLAQAIEEAQQKNTARIAAGLQTPIVELDSDEIVLIRRFSDWSRSRGVVALPSAPSVIAEFIKTENKAGADFNRIWETVRALERAHDAAGLANPVATFAVRHQLGVLYHIDAPRSWPKSSLSARFCATDPQSNTTNGPFARALRLWIVCARTSLPTPVSPRMRIPGRALPGVDRIVIAHSRMSSFKALMAAEVPMTNPSMTFCISP